MGKRAQNPLRRSWLDDSDGGWIPHRLKLLVSPAWRHRPIPLAKILERIEIEHMRHAGRENGHLIVSYDQLVEHGVSRRTIRGSIDLGVALGLLEVRQSGEWAGDVRTPNMYRLTYLPEKDRKAPTDEWEGIENDKASVLIAEYQNGLSKKQTPSARTCTPPVPKPAVNTPSTSAKTCKSPVPKRTLPLISGRKSAEPDGERSHSVSHHTRSDATAPAPSLQEQRPEPIPVSAALTSTLKSWGAIRE